MSVSYTHLDVYKRQDILKHLFLEYISLETRQGTPFKVLLIVAETAHKKNWKEEFTKWKVEDYIWRCV